MSLPKVLILNQPFNNDTGGGITLTNLFSGWDKDNLAVACSGYLLSMDVDMQICDNYYQLGHKERKWIFPFNFLKRKYQSGVIKKKEGSITHVVKSKSKLRIKIIMKFVYPFLDYIGVADSVAKTTLSPELLKWIHDFNPDIIYAQAAFREDVLFCTLLHSHLKKPLIFHMMDDWPSTIGSKGLFKKFCRKRIDQELRILFDRADILLSISDLMATEYKLRYGKTFITFHNPINLEFWKEYQRSNYELTDSPTILYAGRVGLGIDDSLELMAKAIQLVNDEMKISIIFKLQTREKPVWAANYKNVVHSGFVNYNDLPQKFSEADFLLLPYDFSSKSVKFIKYSMPTKAPEYMVSGTPIIIFSPKETAIVKYANGYNWAIVITEDNIDVISETIKSAIKNKELREQTAFNAISLAETNHNSVYVTDEFKKIILSISN